MKTFLKNHVRKILLGGVVLSAIFVATACSSSGSVDITRLNETESGKIVPLGNVDFDWGDIDIQGGLKDSPLFKFKNDGDGDLIIKTASTSCMCTTATVTLKDSTISPAFGMHEAINWGGVVAPGEEFTVKVVFDPLAHGPDAVGPIDRFVTITTSSVSNGNYAKKPAASHEHSGNVVSGNVTELTLSGNVLYKDDFAAKYPNGKPEVGTEKAADEKVSEGDSVGTKASQQVDYINFEAERVTPENYSKLKEENGDDLNDVNPDGGDIFIVLTLDNHNEDLTGFDYKSMSKLGGQVAVAWKVFSTAAGGHHVEGLLTFPSGTFPSPLVISDLPVGEVTLNF
jgi:hypothetical protein